MSEKVEKEKAKHMKAIEFGKNVARVRKAQCKDVPDECAEDLAKKTCDSHFVNGTEKERLYCKCKVEAELEAKEKSDCNQLEKKFGKS